MNLESVRKIADAVLLEGYALYPYHSSSSKNRYRWTFGVLSPRKWSESGGGERWRSRTDVLLQGRPDGARVRISGCLRFLQVIPRMVRELRDGELRDTQRLDIDGQPHVSWQEGELRELSFEIFPDEAPNPYVYSFELRAGEEQESLRSADGKEMGRIVRTSSALEGRVLVCLERTGVAHPEIVRLSLQLENSSECPALPSERERAMCASFASAHVVLSLENAAFLSRLDPPVEAAEAAKACQSEGLYPVLAGDPDRADLVLCSPIILYDYPQIAPESPGDFYDATEIDELLTLRTLTLTPDEKELARALDARTRGLIDRVDGVTEEGLSRLHGTLREQADVVRYQVGSRVRLRPGRRRTDAQDALFAGQIATVESVRQDVDGRTLLLLTMDEDPAAELHRWYGRYLYYGLDEVEPFIEEQT